MTIIQIVVSAHGIGKGTGSLRNKSTSKDHPDYCVKIGENTEKSPSDLRQIAVTQTLVIKHQQTLVRKTLKISSNDKAMFNVDIVHLEYKCLI